MNTSLHIAEFIKLSEKFPVIDVRSPGEFQRGHIPGAHNIPLFDDDERAKVGTKYKQTGRRAAIKLGLELAGKKLAAIISQVEKIILAAEYSTSNSKHPTCLVHCWRGGMRSANVAWLLNLYGIKTYTLIKGYKAYRNFVLSQVFGIERKINIVVLGGETGSGKTEILKKISEAGEKVICLESLAHHKGSAFGSLGEKPQPTQEQFENNLAHEIIRLSEIQTPVGNRLWLEDESRNIGTCQIPRPLWERMKEAPIIRIKIPKEERIRNLVRDYGQFSKEQLASCIIKIEKRLGPQHAKRALEELEKGNLHTVADIALTYYDKAYNYAHEKRNFKDVFLVECATADTTLNAKEVLEFVNKKFKKEHV